MKQLTTLLAAAALMLSAQANAGKTVVLDVQRALLSSNAASDFRKQLQAEFADDEKQLVDLEKQARALQEKLQKNAGLSSDEELKQLRLQFQKAFGEYQRRGQELQQQRAQREQAFIGEMKPRLDEIIQGLIKTQDIDLIVNKQATIFVAPTLDITQSVVEQLNK
ncbi:OmpH family outer membrane protein [Marinobacterium sp. D7]|uniref:OmpH family outer membrane protein n=1 Tax=Marinobacterium ramblicola TaxID=2849041 RepID=UPI001C2DB03F|nr:OmpH family outer membrane protein [Marinobacterium ramblicola]MBV1788816.1 OmpH family outer membrane protein [Marinobacterium ramblicola]